MSASQPHAPNLRRGDSFLPPWVKEGARAVLAPIVRLAMALGGGTAFGSFLDSTLDRAGEAILYTGIGVWLLRTQPEPMLPVLALLVALAGSFLVSYAHARAEGIGLAANIGLAPRTERLVLVLAGVAPPR